MATIAIDLKTRTSTIYVQYVDRHEEKDGWLILYSGDKEMGRYNLEDVSGHHEYKR